MHVLTKKTQYAMISVDVEALPRRASSDHVKKLMWGEFENGSAGLREICSIASEVKSNFIFFVDVCGALDRKEEISEVVTWLDSNGQDVQLHLHPEYLPEEFWKRYRLKFRPRFMNQYEARKALFSIRYFGSFISKLTGKPLRAFRSGSFRWNADTIRALHEVGIPLSFNNSMNACLAGQCTYSEPTNHPFIWSNGVIEVPVTERKFFPLLGKEWWGRLQFPVGDWFGNPPWRVLRPYTSGGDASFLVMLIHSWSLLYWDKNGHAVYRDDKRTEDFRKVVHKLSKDYDIITTSEFLDLQASGKIPVSHKVELSAAEMKSSPRRKSVKRARTQERK
jgi:hypothetical protein